MDNRKQPLGKVLHFADQAKNVGCYSKTQRYNLGTAWAVLLESLASVGLNDHSTIEQLQPKIADALKERGRNTKVSAASLRAYQARINKLLDDFTKWNEGDFMKWKEEIDKPSENGDSKPKRRKAQRQRANSDGAEGDVDSITHRLIAAEGKEGKLALPPDLTDEEVDRVWAQIDALKGYIKAQMAALKGKTPKTPTP